MAKSANAQDSWRRLSHVHYQVGANALLRNATELFLLHYQLMESEQAIASSLLHQEVDDAMTQFLQRCQSQQLAPALIRSAEYVLCALIDESILNAPWTEQTDWRQRSLLALRFNETWGGNTVFTIRQFCMAHLQDNIALLELIYVCLCLGFRGKFALEQGGDLQLERIKRETYQVIHDYRGVPLQTSETDVVSTSDKPVFVTKKLKSLGLLLVSLLLLLGITYGGLSYFLSQSALKVSRQIQQLSVPLLVKRPSNNG